MVNVLLEAYWSARPCSGMGFPVSPLSRSDLRDPDDHSRPQPALEGSTLGPRKISAWREAVAPFWDVRIRKEDTQDFRGRSEVYHLGNAIVGFTAASELRIERSQALVARMGVDHVAIKMRMEGHATVKIGDREAPLAPATSLCSIYRARLPWNRMVTGR